MTDGWGQKPSDGWDSGGANGSAWGSADGSWPASGGSDTWGTGEYTTATFEPPAPVSVAPLFAAIGFGVVGIVLSFFGSSTSPVAPIVGWLLCTFGDVLAVAWYQQRDLNASFTSMDYRPSPSAATLRGIALGLAVVGIVANSYAFAHWLAIQ